MAKPPRASRRFRSLSGATPDWAPKFGRHGAFQAVRRRRLRGTLSCHRALICRSRAREPSSRPSPGALELIARNRPPPVAGVSFMGSFLEKSGNQSHQDHETIGFAPENGLQPEAEGGAG